MFILELLLLLMLLLTLVQDKAVEEEVHTAVERGIDVAEVTDAFEDNAARIFGITGEVVADRFSSIADRLISVSECVFPVTFAVALVISDVIGVGQFFDHIAGVDLVPSS